MTHRFGKVSDWLYFFGLLPLLTPLPRRWSGAVLERQASRLVRCRPFHRSQVEKNLRRVLGTEHSEAEREQILKASFSVWVWEDFEAFSFPFWNRDNIGRYFRFEGLDHLDRALEKGKGALLFSGHFGSTCAAVIALSLRGYPVRPLIHDSPEDDSFPPPFRAYARRKIRWMDGKLHRPSIVLRFGDEEKRGGLASVDVYQTLAQNGLVTMAIDIPPHLVDNREEVLFLNRACRFPSGLLKLAYLSGSPLIPYFSRRDEEDWTRQRLWVESPVEPTGDLKTDLQACVDRLSLAVRRYPAQWLSWDSLDHFLLEDRDSEGGTGRPVEAGGAVS